MNNVKRTDRLKQNYKMCFYTKFNYSLLNMVKTGKKPGKGDKSVFNDVIISLDTETSKTPDYTEEHRINYIVAWTISIRFFHTNIVTLYGSKPSQVVECLHMIINNLKGDKTLFYVHNLSYDWVFLRKFFLADFGNPTYQLNTKSHYPVTIEFGNGIVLKDSLILSQKSLEKWSVDMACDHQKACGMWDYNQVRYQNYGVFSYEELMYIEHDTLCLVECIDALCVALKKRVFQLPITATGIPREEVQKRGQKNHAHTQYKDMVLSYEQYQMMLVLYHGGYTHANRYIIGDICYNVRCYDFSSSYPFCLLAFKYPCSAFYSTETKDIETILNTSNKYAYMFRLVLFDVELKDYYEPMPVLQVSKAINVISPVVDNGRVISCNMIELITNEVDADIIFRQYNIKGGYIINNCQYATKKYLPRWFTDYVYELYRLKTQLKGGNPVDYALAKAKLNSLYGLCVQRLVMENIVENYETGEYFVQKCLTPEEQYKNDLELFNKKNESQKTVLSYAWGVWCTSYAMHNLYDLGACVNDSFVNGKRTSPSHWLYSDTDSCYSDSWNTDKVNAYNEHCKKLLRDNGYGPVLFNNREYWLGIAETSEDDVYTQFKTVGAKRYCGIHTDGELSITVAGVPKKNGAKCLKNLNRFKKGFVFKGSITKKLAHTYIDVPEIYIDQYGNEIGDCLDLTECDYKLDEVDTTETVINAFTNIYELIDTTDFE